MTQHRENKFGYDIRKIDDATNAHDALIAGRNALIEKGDMQNAYMIQAIINQHDDGWVHELNTLGALTREIDIWVFG